MRLIAGESKDHREWERALSGLARKGIEWVHGEVLELDPKTRRVRTSSGMLEEDYLVIALGAEKDGSGIPGFAESAYDLYDSTGALRIYNALQEFDRGRAVILISRSPFSCPAAPYEAAFLMDSAFRTKGNRKRVDITIYTPEPKPMPGAGPETGNAVVGMLKERDIAFYLQQKLQKVESGSRKIVFEGSQARPRLNPKRSRLPPVFMGPPRSMYSLSISMVSSFIGKVRLRRCPLSSAIAFSTLLPQHGQNLAGLLSLSP